MFVALRVWWLSRKLLSERPRNDERQVASALAVIGTSHSSKVLLRALRHEYRSVRAAAAAALRSSNDPNIIDALVRMMGDESEHVRAAAAESVGSTEDPVPINALIRLLRDGSNVGEAAAAALTRIGESGIDALVGVLKEGTRLERITAVRGLAGSGHPRAREALLLALEDPDATVRGYAVDSLASVGDESCIEPLIEALEDTCYSVRSGAAFALGCLGVVRAVPRICELLRHGRVYKVTGIRALAMLGDPSAIEPIMEIFGAVEGERRVEVAKALEKLGEPEWGRLVHGEYNDDFEALAQSRDPRVLPALAHALCHRPGLMEVIVWYKNPRVVPDLIALLGCPRVDPVQIANALEQLGEPDWKVLVGPPNGRDALVSRLITCQDPRTLLALRNALRLGDHDDRVLAAKEIGRRGGRVALDSLLWTLDDEAAEVRLAAIEALEHLAGPDSIPYAVPERTCLSRPPWLDWDILGWVFGLAPEAIEWEVERHVQDKVALPTCTEPDERRIGDQRRIIAELACRIADTDVQVRNKAIQLLARIDGPRAVIALRRELSNPIPEVRAQVCYALGAIGDRGLVSELINLLRTDADAEVRAASACALGNLGDPCAVEPLIETLKDVGVRPRACAAIALGRLGGTRAVEPLVQTLGFEREPSILEQIGWSASEVGLSARPLRQAVADANLDRAAAARALGRLMDSAALLPLKRALADGMSIVRVCAAEALGDLADEDAVGPLASVMGLGPPLEVTSRIPAPPGREPRGEVKDFRYRLHISDHKKVAAALYVLSQAVGSSPAAAGLKELAETLMTGPDHEFAGTIFTGDACPSYTKLVRDSNPEVRAAAARSLGKLGTSEAKAVLLKAMTDPSDHVRASAAGALGTHGGRDALEALSPLLTTDSSSLVREAVTRALGVMDGPEAQDLFSRAALDSLPDSRDTATAELAATDGEGRTEKYGPGS